MTDPFFPNSNINPSVMHFFLYRTRNPSFQLVDLGYDRAQGDRVRQAPAAVYSSFVGGWRVEEEPLTAEQLSFLRHFETSRAESDVQYSLYKLVNVQNPLQRYRILNMTGEYLPRRGGYEVRRGDVGNGGAALEWRAIEYAPQQPGEPAPTVPRLQVIQTTLGHLETIRNRPILPALPTLTPPINLFTNVITRYSSMLEVGDTMISSTRLKEVAKPLAPYVAKMVVDAQIREGAECPIEMEPLASYTSLLVPICGHVCGPAVKGQTKCPVCREETQWTEVLIDKN